MSFPPWGLPPPVPGLGPGEIAVWWLDSTEARPIETVAARYLGVDPGAVAVGRSAEGKPVVEGAPFAVSLARSGNVTLVAVAQAAAVGVDVETLRESLDGWALPDHALTETERGRLAQAPPGEQAALFLAAWTRKEALLKAAGTGLAVDPGLIELDGNEVVVVPSELGSARGWALAGLVLPGHVGAVALRGLLSGLRHYRVQG